MFCSTQDHQIEGLGQGTCSFPLHQFITDQFWHRSRSRSRSHSRGRYESTSIVGYLLCDIYRIVTEDGVENRAVVQDHQAIEKDILAQGLTVEVDHQKDIAGGKSIMVLFK